MSNKVPQIRFNGYSDAWEERKLIEVADYRNGKAHEKDISEDGYYIVVNSKFVSTNGLVKKYSDEMIAPLSKNEIAFVLSDVPNGRAIARTFLINEDNKYSLNQRIAGITPHADTNSYFLHSLMNRNHYFLRFDNGVSQTNLSKREVEKWVEFYPSYQEQQKIGSFFKQLDDTIALHQRKLDLLKEQKKGYLQKMFPKNGSKVPELRFAGFADDWEERKLGDHAKYRRGSFPQPYGNKEWYDGEGAMPFVQVVDVTNKLTLVENTKQKISKLAQSKSVFVPKGKVVVTLQGSIGRVAITQYDSFVDRTLLIFENYEKETDERFWAYTIQKKFEIEKLKAPGGTIKTITKEALSSFDVHLPKFEEQQKIGSFFRQLDETIALHQRKLELLKEQKKGFLQKMFV